MPTHSQDHSKFGCLSDCGTSLEYFILIAMQVQSYTNRYRAFLKIPKKKKYRSFLEILGKFHFTLTDSMDVIHLLTAARLREILDSAGLAHENLSPNAVTSAQMLASVSNLLNIKDTEMSR
jgi:hypothetical protein